jgi:hypothetical protein
MSSYHAKLLPIVMSALSAPKYTKRVDPLEKLIVAFMANRKSWNGTITELHRALKISTYVHDITDVKIPKTPQLLSKKLNEIEDSLNDKGVVFERERTSSERTIKLTNANLK